MEDSDSKPLSAYVGTRPLATDELVRLAKALTERVGQDHALDVVRGDLRPENVLWNGVEVDLPEPVRQLELPEAPGELRGEDALRAVGYLAPEVIAGEEPSQRSDVFMIGTMLYEAATGEHPFADPRGDQIAANVESYDPRPPGHLRRELPLEVDAIVACCMHKNPKERYASALDALTHVKALEQSGGKARRDLRVDWGRVALAFGVLAGIVLLLVWLL